MPLISVARVLVLMGAGLAPVQEGFGPGITLSCLPQTPEVADLCLVMRDVIAAASPGETVRLGQPETDPEKGLAIRLTVERLKKDAIAAHLAWRQPGGNWERGETRAFNVMDRDLNTGMIAAFFKALWGGGPAAR